MISRLLLVWLVLAFPRALHGEDGAAKERGAQDAPMPTLGDKTLVAWVQLANRTQRGGAAITLFDAHRNECFDAIVFGEKSPGKWMAGSDFFHRTEGDQSRYPSETAGPEELVQVAIVYRGRQIELYRNGAPYASYQVERPQPFAEGSFVLLGLRYLGAMGPIGPLAGAIEEARVYRVALDARAIAALAPNKPSEPRPLAQWTFEDGTARDSMGTFPPGKVVGGARIAGGRLHLDGVDDYVVCRRSTVQTMFYQPTDPDSGAMWDTWLYLDNGTYYLYLLSGPGGRWHGVALATSPDGVHWKEHGLVVRKAEGVTWLGTGSTWRSPHYEQDKKFFMNFSEWRGPRQTIFFAESKDLVHWTRLGPEYEFKQDPRWYEPNGRWDCIYTIPRPGGGLFGYWTADPKGRPGVGFGQSLDGVRWEALEPPQFVDKAPHGEAGAVERFGDRCYLMLGAGGGMVTLVADQPQGPFRPAKKNYQLLHPGPTYFSRFFPVPGGVLVNHHSISRQSGVYFAPLKRAVVDRDGTLRLAWWEGNEKLKHRAIPVTPAQAPLPGAPAVFPLDPTFDVGQGVIVEGSIKVPQSRPGPPGKGPDKQVGQSGLCVVCAGGQRIAIFVGPRGVTQIGPLAGDGSGFTVEQRVDREMPVGTSARFRLLVKHSLLEFYLDDVLMHCYSLPDAASGRIGVVRSAQDAFVGEIRAWQ